MRNDPWTDAEDHKLIMGRVTGHKWDAIAADLPGRTGSSASARHRYLIAINAGTYRRKRPYVPTARPVKADTGIAGGFDAGASGDASDKLREATDRLYLREAARRKLPVQTVILLMQEGPASVARWQAQAA